MTFDRITCQKGNTMLYATNESLPSRVKIYLPPGAQTIFRKAFNNALEEHKDEARASKTAWAAVKHKYAKQGDQWVSKDAYASATDNTCNQGGATMVKKTKNPQGYNKYTANNASSGNSSNRGHSDDGRNIPNNQQGINQYTKAESGNPASSAAHKSTNVLEKERGTRRDGKHAPNNPAGVNQYTKGRTSSAHKSTTTGRGKGVSSHDGRHTPNNPLGINQYTKGKSTTSSSKKSTTNKK